MPNWPTNPEWIDLLNINKGNEYVAADGVTVTDMNSIINDLLYLKAHSSGGGGSTNIQGENFTYRVAPGENIEAGSFVGVTGTYGDGIFADVAVANNSIELCRSGNNVYVFFYDTTNQTNKVVRLSIDNETNQVIISPQVNLGKITSLYAVTALSENNFIMFYVLNRGISIRYISIDFEKGTATIQDPIEIIAPPGTESRSWSRPRVVLGPTAKLYIFATKEVEYRTCNLSIYSFDIDTRQTTWLHSTAKYTNSYNNGVQDVQAINANIYIVSYATYVIIAQIYENTASTFVSASCTGSSWHIGVITNNLFIITSQLYDSYYDYSVYIQLCRINTDYSITVLDTQSISSKYDRETWPTVIVINSTTAYVFYKGDEALYYSKVHIQDDKLTYQLNSFERVTPANPGRCISLKKNSFLWFYGDSVGKFTQRDENFIPTDNDILGNIYVTKRLINRNQYIGIATTGAQSNQLINVTVPYASYPIKVQTVNCTYITSSVIIGKDETVTLSFKPKDASYKLPSSINVINAKYIWNSSTGELIISEAENDVYISVTAEFAGLYTYNTATVPNQGTATSLTLSVNCNVGDLIIAAFAIRSDLVSLSDGWTLISTSEKIKENQTLSWAQKVAESTTESITVTQTSAARIYINLIALPGATAVVDNGYKKVTKATSISVNRPSGLVLFGLTADTWQSTKPYPVWTSSIKDMPIIQLGESMQSRLGVALDQTTESTVSFYSQVSTDMIVGSLTVQGITKFY